MAKLSSTFKSILKETALGLIWAYRYFLSPWLGFHCRFQPTCSAYAKEALITRGFLKGAYLSLSRVLRCHPWHPGGNDSVPLKKK